MAVSFDSFNHKFVMNVKGQLSHNLEIGSDPLGNITRINNALESMPRQLEEAQTKLATVEHQLETAKVEVTKPFAQETELAEKLDRLSALNALLNMDEKGDNAIGMDDDTPDVKIADKPAARVSLKERLAEMKVKVAGNQVEKPVVKEKGKEETLKIYISFRANLIYNISTKGSEDMTQTEQIRNLLADNDGMIRTSQVTDAGITKTVFYQYVKDNDMEQISHGVYATKDTWTDAMYLVHLRCKQAVFSHETALFLHDLTDREPMEYEITVKTGYNPSKLKEDGIKVYTVKKELHGEGIIMMQTPFGHLVPVYNMERTICDIIRNRNNTEMQTFQSALKQYAKRKDKNLRLLMQYAAKFHVDKILKQYLEVLL